MNSVVIGYHQSRMKENLTCDGNVERLSLLFKEWSGEDVSNIECLAGAGSGRKYYRLTGLEHACVGTVSENLADSDAFINLSALFRGYGVPVPEVYIVSADRKYYLQQDLGSESLFDHINKVRNAGGSEIELRGIVKKCIDGLVRLQNIKVKDLERSVSYPQFCHRQVIWDLNYFKYEYLKPAGFEFDENSLEDDFLAYADEIVGISKKDEGFMYRDFQSRNVMLKDGEPYFIDFQGGRIGPRIYDIVSFLWQAKAGFSADFRKELLEYYRKRSIFERSSMGRDENLSADEYYDAIQKVALFRTLQVLGAYGLRGLVERKSHFIESIPAALKNLSELIRTGVADGYPELKKVCERICGDPRFSDSISCGLLISVFSFSYKKGYPVDFTGNGGGFMFDCRGMHNPGRYDEFKPLTGRDQPVIDYLEERGEVQEFCRKAVELVGPSAECYIRRGFSNLQVGFGCTGGRHRSVYCAERVAKELAMRFPEATVKLIHREQGLIINKL